MNVVNELETARYICSVVAIMALFVYVVIKINNRSIK